MATVHRAIERGIEGFERVVALKRLLPHLAEDEGFVRAFVREAKLASLLQHGNIVQLYELGRVGASYFISMEYIPGRDLRVILRQARRVCGPPPVEIALAVMTELLDALDYAHSQVGADGKPLGLVHRDISPSNLLISHTGHLKVIDFGIAKATLGHLMTHTGRIKGKLSYMAPEALAGRTLDGRSDLFSASVIAHELLTATPLFAAKDDFQTIDRLQNMKPPPPSSRNPSCPPELDDIVLRGLAKDPTQRWRSAAEMRGALAELAIDHHRLATNREVCDWVEEAFEMPLPSRMRIPAAAPQRGNTGPHERRAVAPIIDSDDEIMDIVWGVTGPRSPLAVVLEDVPDVSARFARVDGTERGDPLASNPLDRLDDDGLVQSLSLSGAEEEPTNAMGRPNFDSTSIDRGSGDARVRFRPGSPQSLSLSSAAAVAERTPHGGLVSQVSKSSRQTSPGRPVTRPPAWAMGTSPTNQQQPDELLEEAVAAARRAEPLPPPASTTFSAMAAQQRPSLVPLLIASVAVAAAGAAIAWIVSSGDGDGQVVASAPPAPAAVVQPAPPPPQVTQGVVQEPAPAPAEPAFAEDEPERPGDHPGDARRRRIRRERDERPVHERERAAAAADIREAAGIDPRPEERAPAEVARPEPPAADPAPAAKATKATGSVADGALQPLPVPVPAPVTQPSHATAPAPARSRGPIIVGPSRTRRESGTVPPLKFPRWEKAPSQLTAKLCIDVTGAVTSVNVISPVSQEIRNTVVRGLSQWKYRPVVEGDEKVAACFATTFRIQVE